MFEAMIIICFVTAAFCAGYLSGSIDKRKISEARMREVAMRNYLLDSIDKEEEIDHLSRQSLAFSQKQKHWIKVYDAEVIE
tara:strand:- start:81 stop:323 length:243 start_codon:yes stop_codon:yes gene_type:complete